MFSSTVWTATARIIPTTPQTADPNFSDTRISAG
jgi:hypothetical protein